MGRGHLEAEPELRIPRRLRWRVESASIATASHIARIGDGALRPAVIAIADADLVLVTERGTRRWNRADLDRVDGDQIVPLAGAPVAIGSWRDAEARAVFLRAVRELLGQPEPAAVAIELPLPDPLKPVDTDRLVVVVGAFGGGIALIGLLALLADGTGNWEGIRTCAVSAALLGLPCLVLSGKLATVDSKWRWLGVAGIALGGLASLLLVFVIQLAVA